MDLKQFEKLAADNKYELVRMRVVHGYAPYPKDSIAGFSPSEALRLYNHGEAVPVDEKGNEIKLAAPKKAPAPAPEPGIEIPEGWDKLHYLQRIKLAEKISGRQLANNEKDVADVIIREELAKRAGAAAPEGASGEGGAPAAPPADA